MCRWFVPFWLSAVFLRARARGRPRRRSPPSARGGSAGAPRQEQEPKAAAGAPRLRRRSGRPARAPRPVVRQPATATVGPAARRPVAAMYGRRPGVVSRYAHDKFSDWSYPVRRRGRGKRAWRRSERARARGACGERGNAAWGARSTRAGSSRLPRRAQVQCCVWTASVLGPVMLVLGVILLVRPRRWRGVLARARTRSGAAFPVADAHASARRARAWRCATRPRRW
jgi:hypothetical protein